MGWVSSREGMAGNSLVLIACDLSLRFYRFDVGLARRFRSSIVFGSVGPA